MQKPEPDLPSDVVSPPRPVSQLARLVLAAFLLTFLSARVFVFLIMARRIPDLFLCVGGTHVHHLNYGIVLLAGIGAALLFHQPRGRALTAAAVIYGVGLALTFDEFGMWLHLGGGYWQRASFDAVVVITAALSLIAAGPTIARFQPRHWLALIVLLLLGIAFAIGLVRSLRYMEGRVQPRLQQLERDAPPG